MPFSLTAAATWNKKLCGSTKRPGLAPVSFLDVLRLKYFHLGIDFFGSVWYTMVTRSVESDGRGHGNSPLAAVGDREAVGSRILRSNLHQMRQYFNKGERFLVSNNQVSLDVLRLIL